VRYEREQGGGEMCRTHRAKEGGVSRPQDCERRGSFDNRESSCSWALESPPSGRFW
jgi:hypothetical protein